MKTDEIIKRLSAPLVFSDRIQYYFDESVDQDCVNPLCERGISVLTVEELGSKGEKDDEVHFVRATELGAVLVTVGASS